MGWAIVDWKKEKPELKGDYTRSESTQSKNILELLNIFEKEKVYATFVFTFVTYNYVHHENYRYDIDMASFGIVKSLANGQYGYKQVPWIPKQSFFDIGKFYADH